MEGREGRQGVLYESREGGEKEGREVSITCNTRHNNPYLFLIRYHKTPRPDIY